MTTKNRGPYPKPQRKAYQHTRENGYNRHNIARTIGAAQDHRERAKDPAPVRVIRPGDPEFEPYEGTP